MLFFLLYINDIPNRVNCTLCLALSINILENQLKDELNNICNWISTNNLMLNSKKSQILIILPNIKSSNVVLNIQSPAGEIKTIYKAKYLGIIFDK